MITTGEQRGGVQGRITSNTGINLDLTHTPNTREGESRGRIAGGGIAAEPAETQPTIAPSPVQRSVFFGSGLWRGSVGVGRGIGGGFGAGFGR